MISRIEKRREEGLKNILRKIDRSLLAQAVISNWLFPLFHRPYPQTETGGGWLGREKLCSTTGGVTDPLEPRYFSPVKKLERLEMVWLRFCTS